MITSTQLFQSACLAAMLSGVFSAVVRWRHMCHPCDQDPEHYYPGRHVGSLYFLLMVLMFPYWIDPLDEGAWLYVKLFGITYCPMFYSLMLRCYFKRERLYSSHVRILTLAAPLALLLAMIGLVMLGGEPLLVKWARPCIVAGCVVSAVLSFDYVLIVRWVYRRIGKFHADNYSSPDDFPYDFPYDFAKRMIVLPVFIVLLMWLVVIVDSHWLKMWVDVAFTVGNVVFLCAILHPQIPIASAAQAEQEIEQEEAPAGADDVPGAAPAVDNSLREQVEQQLEQVLLESFRNPHLTKADVLRPFPYGKKRVASQIIRQFGIRKSN